MPGTEYNELYSQLSQTQSDNPAFQEYLASMRALDSQLKELTAAANERLKNANGKSADDIKIELRLEEKMRLRKEASSRSVIWSNASAASSPAICGR